MEWPRERENRIRSGKEKLRTPQIPTRRVLSRFRTTVKWIIKHQGSKELQAAFGARAPRALWADIQELKAQLS